MQDRVGRDVKDGIPPAQDGEEPHSGHRVRDAPDRGDRKPPQDQADGEGDGEPTANQVDRQERSDESAGADRRRQDPHARAPHVEPAQRRHDDQHVEGAADERLGPAQEDGQADVAVPHE